MKQKKTAKGLIMIGSLRSAGITIYMKQGQLITRVSNSNEKRSNTLGQFVQRQKMRHAIALWRMLKLLVGPGGEAMRCDVMFTQRPTAYNNFTSLANRLPAVYVEKKLMDRASFLMPGIPVSDGTLPAVKLELGEVDGEPALLSDLTNETMNHLAKLWLYTAVQDVNGGVDPMVRFSIREVSWQEMSMVDGRFVLKGEEYADNMKGWALVKVIGNRCSPQTIVTRCKLYEQYTTEEALQAAAKSYGGLTGTQFLTFKS